MSRKRLSVIIDSHAHISAPVGVFAYQARLIASGGYPATKHPATGRHLDNMYPYIAECALLSEDERQGILSRNAGRLFGLVTAGA